MLFFGRRGRMACAVCQEKIRGEARDYFIFGHRHIPLDLPIAGKARYINLGDWINHYTYAVFDGHTLELTAWKRA